MTLVPLGQVLATPGVLESFTHEFLVQCVRAHIRGDWGTICEQDKKANDRAVDKEERIVSAYELEGRKMLVITEYDRSVTTLLLPDEY